jgi:hypothetical protein
VDRVPQTLVAQRGMAATKEHHHRGHRDRGDKTPVDVFLCGLCVLCGEAWSFRWVAHLKRLCDQSQYSCARRAPTWEILAKQTRIYELAMQRLFCLPKLLCGSSSRAPHSRALVRGSRACGQLRGIRWAEPLAKLVILSADAFYRDEGPAFGFAQARRKANAGRANADSSPKSGAPE